MHKDKDNACGIKHEWELLKNQALAEARFSQKQKFVLLVKDGVNGIDLGIIQIQI